MARRLSSFMVRMKGGPTLGGTGTEVYVYDDEALTTLSTLYVASSGAPTQPNPMTPNAGVQTTLRTATLTTDTVLNVVSIAGFAVGNMIPVYNGTVTRFRVITALNPVGPTITVDSAIGTAFATSNTLVNRPSMRGHVWFYVDDVRDYFFQPKDVGSTELMPPLQIATRVPTTVISIQDEGVSTGTSRAILNFIGSGVTAVDDPANSRVNVTILTKAADVQVFTASGTWTKPASAKAVEVIVIGPGGGGSGAKGAASGTDRRGGGGGGGGAFARMVFDPSALGATETVTIGAGGTSGAGGASADGADGGIGGTSSFGAHLRAFGGGGGRQGDLGDGGGGGGTGAAGATSGSGGSPGAPNNATPSGGGGAIGNGNAEYGGGGGGRQFTDPPTAGGSSLYGGPGGGSGGRVSAANAENAGAAGGAYGSYVAGGGGAGGAVNGGAGTAGTSRSGTGKAGDGGGGGGSQDSGTGGAGGAGGAPGGGGGGGAGGTTTGGAGGVGGRGEVIVITYF